jgi:hypothetical protein
MFLLHFRYGETSERCHAACPPWRANAFGEAFGVGGLDVRPAFREQNCSRVFLAD